MEGILDFSGDLDIGLFDRVVNAMFVYGPEQTVANTVLEQFRQHPDAWKRVDAILERSQVLQSKYIALSILETLIKSMWRILPEDQRAGIKNFVVAFIIKNSSDDETLEKNRLLLGKLNIVLVQILKQEWPHNWPTFIPELVSSSKTNLSLCENNMNILKLLSEEIFDFSAEQMTSTKAKNLKDTMGAEFSEIFQICLEVLEKARKPSLINATLETLLRFLNWIPLGYIFETNLVDILMKRFFIMPEFRNVSLKCLTEVASLTVQESNYQAKFVELYTVTIDSIPAMLPVETDLKGTWDLLADNDQQFVQNLALFFTTFFSIHGKEVEVLCVDPSRKARLYLGHQYLLAITAVDDRELFKICLEYWTKLVGELFQESLRTYDPPLLNLSGIRTPFGNNNPLRKHLYADALSRLRTIMIEQMVKPEEVIVVENDEGEVVRESLKESDTIVLYKSMRETLVYSTHLDCEDMERIMSGKLRRQSDGSEWSWGNLNKLCWAIGSISGAMEEDMEKRFLVTVIKELLSLVELKKGKDNKAIVASNIMYIVGQYPRFLKAHWKFLKTVVNKLFEFMHERHEGVQEMACDTFIKIAQKCKRLFVITQHQEPRPYIDDILEGMGQITMDLATPQLHTFYEAVGYIISAQTRRPDQERLINTFMDAANKAWDDYIAQARQNPTCLETPETVKLLSNIIKTNISACTSIGPSFYVQIARNYLDLLALYVAVGELIGQHVQTKGLIATVTPTVRALRTIKKDVLRLIETYIHKADDPQTVVQTLIPPLLDTVLGDYARSVEPAKDAVVLHVLSRIMDDRVGPLMNDQVPAILDAVFECTLNMVNKNFEDYPEHRVGFFNLMRTINKNSFQALLRLPPPQFRLFLDSIVWAFKHTMRDINDTGLSIILEMLTNFSEVDRAIANQFYQTYFLSLLQDIFFVLTNPFHKSGFKLQSMILRDMFTLVRTPGKLTVPLFDPSQVPDMTMTNEGFVSQYVMDLLQRAFPHLQSAQIRNVVLALFTTCEDEAQFKTHLRDFLVTLKEFTGDDNSELYRAEREAEAEARIKQERDKALQVPGLLKPSELPDNAMGE
ncbi:CRM1 C terminal-domain-containing protein [Fimicolochytrium jonesii]|uniref:CRM1 C terminal-domain-containing protein n=1 Tax=Fimicolochytrium jonesii TaxID=1396493 RepID=UPI0022FECEAA|nr:CRM1 C terminal-domain-containing protein [Fimicolochytrium jonesii]KAI8818152.1 CRM1 C terminal-domain-containing protein [Fimicolochytrium jonesii]